MKQIATILIITLTIIIAGFYLLVLNDPFASCKYNFRNIFSDCASCMGDCYSKIAFEKKDLDICKKIKNKELKNRCITCTAEGKNDTAICKNVVIVPGLSPNNDINEFIDTCLFNVAITNKNSSICDMIKTESFKSECYRDSRNE